MDYTFDKYRGLKKWIIIIFCLLAILPLAPMINRYIPPLMLGDWNVDLLVSVLSAALFTFVMARLFHFLIIPVLVIFVGVVLYNSITSGHGFAALINDYQVMVETNWGKKEEKERNLVVMPSFFGGPLTRTVKLLQARVNYRDSTVRNFAVRHSIDYFDEYYQKYGPLVRPLSLFKYINTNFKYVSDSERDEYFATPKETILNGLGGDCDDHSILMVSAMEAIGMRCRMVLTQGHLYPELFCGDSKNFEKYKVAIMNLFNKEMKGSLYFHEKDGEYWLNLDYSARHPGGPYVSDKAFAIIY